MSLLSRVDIWVTNLFSTYTINIHSRWINIKVVLIPNLSPLSIFLNRYVISIMGGSESHAAWYEISEYTRGYSYDGWIMWHKICNYMDVHLSPQSQILYYKFDPPITWVSTCVFRYLISRSMRLTISHYRYHIPIKENKQRW